MDAGLLRRLVEEGLPLRTRDRAFLQVVDASNQRKKVRGRAIKNTMKAAMQFKRVTGKLLPSPAAFNIASFLR
jgi:hypothetical protein